MRLAVIPARGGSKRIPRKNIKFFGGKPMIAWSIEAALRSGRFDQVVVSTDDVEIAEVASAYGATVPFIRPDNLSNDHAGTIPVIQHATDWFVQRGQTPDAVCCIYATAPFVQSDDIQRGLDSLLLHECDYAFAVTSYAFPIQRAVRVLENGRVQMFEHNHETTRSQDLIETYHDAGQFYWGTVTAWLEARPIFSNGSVPIILPRHRVQDIDTPEDWLRAEWLFKAMQMENQTI